MSYKEILEPRHKKVLSIAKNYKAERFLDIGCGDGSFTVILKEAFNAKEVYGVELVKEAVDKAQKRGVICICLDIDKENLPYEDEYFDAIFAGNIIEHLLNPDHLLAEVYRTLKRGGIFLIITDNLASWHSRLLLLLGYQPYTLSIRFRSSEKAIGQFLHPVRSSRYPDPDAGGDIGHVSLFTLRALLEALRFCGLEIKAIKGSPCIPLFHIPYPLSVIVSLLEKVTGIGIPSLASYVIIEAKKWGGKRK